MESIQELKRLLSKPQRVVVVTHFKPDADALGSSLGLAGYLQHKGHAVQVVTPSDYPEFLYWMPGQGGVMAWGKSGVGNETILQAIGNADLIFCLDFSSLKRINDLEDVVRSATAIKVIIDHHLEPEDFAQFKLWDTSAASTAGLIYEFIDQFGDASFINAEIASCLYAGLMTDTGGFRHNNTRRREFDIAGALVGAGANPHQIAKAVYDSNTLERLRLTGYVLSEKLQVLTELRTAYIALSAHELAKYGAQTGDTEGLVNHGLSIKNVKVCALMYERKDEIKLSFRSLGDFSVNELARNHFEGGGHRNAAGGSSKASLQETLAKFLAVLPSYRDELLKD